MRHKSSFIFPLAKRWCRHFQVLSFFCLVLAFAVSLTSFSRVSFSLILEKFDKLPLKTMLSWRNIRIYNTS